MFCALNTDGSSHTFYRRRTFRFSVLRLSEEQCRRRQSARQTERGGRVGRRRRLIYALVCRRRRLRAILRAILRAPLPPPPLHNRFLFSQLLVAKSPVAPFSVFDCSIQADGVVLRGTLRARSVGAVPARSGAPPARRLKLCATTLVTVQSTIVFRRCRWQSSARALQSSIPVGTGDE